MKTKLTLFLFFCISVAFAQAEKDVETAVQKFRTALLAEDAATLNSLTSENLTYGHSSGVIDSQEEFVEVFASKKSDYQKWDVSNQTITTNGKNMAIVRQNVKAEILSTETGTTNKLDLGVMMVWVKSKGHWKLLARQAFRMPG